MTDQCEGSQGVEGDRRADVDQAEKTGSEGDKDDSPNRYHVVSADLEKCQHSISVCSRSAYTKLRMYSRGKRNWNKGSLGLEQKPRPVETRMPKVQRWKR